MESVSQWVTGGGSDLTVTGSPTVVTSGTVTVTSINIQDNNAPDIRQSETKYSGYQQATCNGVGSSGGVISGKCSVVVGGPETTQDDEGSASDAEVSSIDFSGVNMRNKKKREDGDGECVERPMSWEGELSDSEMPTIKREEERGMEGVQVTTTTSVRQPSVDDGKPRPLKFTNEAMMDKVMEHVRANNLGAQTELPLLVDRLLSGSSGYSPVLPQRHGGGPTPSPDSAVYSCYSPTASPVTSRHTLPSPSLSRNNSDASQYGGSQHSSCYSQSYSSVSVSPTQFSPTHSPIQGRHLHRPNTGFPSPVLNSRTAQDYSVQGGLVYGVNRASRPTVEDGSHDNTSVDANDEDDRMSVLAAELVQHSGGLATPPGISRQQLINSPCPICGDKISGFHYGIFSCESCKGFFKRTVQNRKNYVCLRGSSCPVTIATRKKCPACRFEKCLNMGMKLEAIREDRTRGGRSTYQCSYTLPASLMSPPGALDSPRLDTPVKLEAGEQPHTRLVPPLLQEIMEVEHLWQYNEPGGEGGGGGGGGSGGGSGGGGRGSSGSGASQSGGDFLANLCNIADHRLYKIVKWCKSLPLFKNITIDDQISLLINAWCELLLFSCCFRSMSSPGEIRVSLGKCISLSQARELGLGPAIERMLNFTEHLRRLRVDRYEYVAMKVIVLLTSDASDLREPEKVRASQEKALQALQHYTLAHYPDIPSKFGELLLRIPDLQRTCQVGKEMLSMKNKEGEGPSFDLLLELLRGDH